VDRAAAGQGRRPASAIEERQAQPRALLALAERLAGSNLEPAAVVSTKPEHDAVNDLRNVVIASLLPVLDHEQVHNDLVPAPL
jgi:hypothetical protein